MRIDGEQDQRKDWQGGSMVDSFTAYSTPQPSARQKGLYPTRRYQSLRKRVKAIIQTTMITVMFCGIWQMLEYLIYGEVQPRIVDDIMVLFFIPFIYISARD